jgi:hypothetical protein
VSRLAGTRACPTQAPTSELPTRPPALTRRRWTSADRQHHRPVRTWFGRTSAPTVGRRLSCRPIRAWFLRISPLTRVKRRGQPARTCWRGTSAGPQQHRQPVHTRLDGSSAPTIERHRPSRPVVAWPCTISVRRTARFLTASRSDAKARLSAEVRSSTRASPRWSLCPTPRTVTSRRRTTRDGWTCTFRRGCWPPRSIDR